ncbi:hypothetical protein ISN44_As13g009480 [Arabidopsis suecica]|uniref:Uncharacterized protein n=1 Tax=Arabidopsis suecica TaxID=45249 RepID=A0A8T1XR09_ARASU|nr:hypothetical protein ISN44_As13g009480 [Arabidopsis suecica]
MAPSDMACVVLTYTSPWPANHPKSNKYFSDPRLAAYEVQYRQVMAGNGCVVPLKLFEVYPYATNARVLTPYYCGGVMYVSLVLNLFKVMIIERRTNSYAVETNIGR